MADSVRAVGRIAGQALAWAAFAVVVGYLSTAPAYRALEPGHAVLKLAVAHQGRRLEPCRTRSEQELADLPPNMRAAKVCPRERAPVRVELELDGRIVHRVQAPPTGLSRDGMSYVYERLQIPAGAHRLHVRLQDHPQEGFTYSLAEKVELAPGQVLVLGFHGQERGFWLEKP